MKRKVFSALAIVVIAMTACKKEEVNTTELGSAEVSGFVFADLNLTNSVNEGAEGMQVTVEVNTQLWDQQPVPGYNYDKQVYTTDVAADGSYSLTIPATQEGYSIDVTFEDLYTTRTLSGGVTENVKVTQADITHMIYDQANVESQDIAVVTSVNNTVNTYGTATIYGSVNATWENSAWNGIAANQTVDAPAKVLHMANAGDVLWRYEALGTPYGTTDNTIYSLTIDTNGDYVLMLPTENLQGAAVSIDLGMLGFLGSQIQDNWNGTADTTYQGFWDATNGIEHQNGLTYSDGDIDINIDVNLAFTAF